MSYDLILKNARIVDGTGAPWFDGSIVIDDGTIQKIRHGGGADADADEVLDVGERVIAPGFIDMHSHSDLHIFPQPTLDGKIRQGITTEVLGQDGFSMAPMYRKGGDEEWKTHLAGLAGRAERDWAWGSVGEYLDTIDENGIASNMAMLVGHGTVRFNVLGMSEDEPTDSELEEMGDLVTEALEDGAAGLSTGLVYSPQFNATTEEVRVLGEQLVPYSRPYVAHIRSERFEIWEAFDEFMDIGAELGIPLHHSHFKAIGPPQYETAERATELMRYARERGIDYTADQYPYTAGSTMLRALLPPWAKTGDTEETVELLQDNDKRQQIKDDIENWRIDDWHNPGPYTGWDNIVIASVGSEGNERYAGQSIAEVANDMETDPVFAVCDLLAEENMQVTMTLHQLRENSVRHVVQDELVTVGTDGVFGSGRPHPRVYGSFPRILETYVREESLMSLEESVRKMTSFPARIMGLYQKGIIRPGMDADLVVFDPRFVSTEADYENPRRYPKGIPHVLVNGEFVVRDNEVTGALPGQTLRA